MGRREMSKGWGRGLCQQDGEGDVNRMGRREMSEWGGGRCRNGEEGDVNRMGRREISTGRRGGRCQQDGEEGDVGMGRREMCCRVLTGSSPNG